MCVSRFPLHFTHDIEFSVFMTVTVRVEIQDYSISHPSQREVVIIIIIII